MNLQTKLGTARRVERSRIWIEGKRLTAAGFAVGRKRHTPRFRRGVFWR